jgi:hypothetical protein
VLIFVAKNALKLTCEHLLIQKFFRGPPLKGEGKGWEGGREGGIHPLASRGDGRPWIGMQDF